jgi:hypothetical protein
MRRSVAAFATAGGVIYGEGSGLAYLSSSMHAHDEAYSMTGVLPLRVCLLESAARAYVTLDVQPEASQLFQGGCQLRATVDGTLEVWQEVAAQALGQSTRRLREKRVTYAFNAVIQEAEGAVEERQELKEGEGHGRLGGLAHRLRTSLQGHSEEEVGICDPVVEGYSFGAVTATAAHITFASNSASLVPFMQACNAVNTAAASAAAVAAGQHAAQRRLRHLPTTPPRSGHTVASTQPFFSTFSQSPPDPAPFGRSGSASSLMTNGIEGLQSALSRLRVHGSMSSLHQPYKAGHRCGHGHSQGLSWDERVAPNRQHVGQATSRSQPHNAVHHSRDSGEGLQQAASMSVCSTPPRRQSLSRTSSSQLRPLRHEHRGTSVNSSHRRSCVWPPRINGVVRVTSCRDMDGLDAALSGSSDYAGPHHAPALASHVQYVGECCNT